MPSSSLSFFIIGLVVASVTAMETSISPGITIASNGSYSNYSTTAAPLNTTATVTTNVTRTTGTMMSTTTRNITEGYSTTPPFTTMQKGGESTKTAKPLTTPKAMDTSKSPLPATKAKSTTATTAKPKKAAAASDSIGIIILVVIIVVAVVFGVACYFSRRRGRRYSVDFTSRPDDANIPLSTMDPDFPVDSVPQNSLQTFESTEPPTKEPQEPEAKPEVQEEQKAEADKSVVDPSAESAAPAPTPDGSEDKPGEDVVEQSPPALVELSVEEKGVSSNKTSVESLKETNVNNSNNTADLMWSNIFWEVPLDCPV